MSRDDDLARLRADMDQAREASKELASNLWGFYNELTAHGFTPGQALTLTGRFLSSVFTAGGGENE